MAREPGAGWLRRLAGYSWRYRRNVVIVLGGALLASSPAAIR